MACTPFQLTTINTSCGSNLPSIKRMWIGNFDSLSTVGYNYVSNPYYEAGGDEPEYLTDDDGNKIVESINNLAINTTATHPQYWVEYHFRKNTCSAGSEMTVNDNGTHYFTNTVNMVFAKQDTPKRLNIEAIASGDVAVIYEDGNGKYWLMNPKDEVNLSTATSETGTAVGDANQYTLTLSQNSANMPFEIVGNPSASPSVTPQGLIDALMQS